MIKRITNRLVKAMEYRSYCMAIRELRNRGYYKKADEIAAYKHTHFQ